MVHGWRVLHYTIKIAHTQKNEKVLCVGVDLVLLGVQFE